MAKVNSKKGRIIVSAALVLLLFTVSLFLYGGIQGGGFFRVAVPESSPLYQEAQRPVFVYGTLRYSLVRQLVFGADGDPVPAVLPGFARRGLDLVEERESAVEGLLLQVCPAELAALDRYERVGVRYRRLPVVLADGTEAWVYHRL